MTIFYAADEELSHRARGWTAGRGAECRGYLAANRAEWESQE